MTEDAKIAVNILRISQEKRPLAVSTKDAVIERSLTPVSPCKSSSASSLITSTISSTIITPRSLSARSTTGMLTSPYC